MWQWNHTGLLSVIGILVLTMNLCLADQKTSHCLINKEKHLVLKPCQSMPIGWRKQQGSQTFCWSSTRDQWVLIDQPLLSWEIFPLEHLRCHKPTNIPDIFVSRKIHSCFCMLNQANQERFKECQWVISGKEFSLPYIACYSPTQKKTSKMQPKGGWSSLSTWKLIQEGQTYCDPCEYYQNNNRDIPPVYRGE